MADESEQSQSTSTGLLAERADVRRETPNFDRGVLESKTASRLAAFRATEGEPEEVPSDAEESTEEESPAEEAAAKSPEPKKSADAEEVVSEKEEQSSDNSEDEESSEQEEEDEKDESKEQKPAAKRKTPTLPDAHRRSLKAYGWDDDSIEAGLKADSASFIVAAQKIHSTRNAEVAQWAALGRANRPHQEQEQSEGKQPQHINPKTGKVKAVDVDALIEKHGNEDLVREIAGPINEAIELVNGFLPDLLNGVQSIRDSRTEALSKQVEGFFTGKEMDSFVELYGKGDEVTAEQHGARSKVLELADALVVGAAHQGRKLTNLEALALAHDSVSSGFKVQAARKEVRKKVEVRGKSLTLKPSQRGSKDSKAAPKDRGELEARTRNRLKAAFG